MGTGSGHLYAVHFPDGTVERRIFLGPPKNSGQVITLDGKPWRVARVVEEGSLDGHELHLGALEGYPVLLITGDEERRAVGFFVYRGKLPEPDQFITVEETLTFARRPARVTRVERDSEFPIHATEELDNWPHAHVRSSSAKTKQPQAR